MVDQERQTCEVEHERRRFKGSGLIITELGH